MNTRPDLSDFQALRRFRQHGKRAPYKPILLLIALSKFREGETDIVFGEIEPLFAELNETYGLFGDKPQLRYPFGRLASDGGIWSLRPTDAPDLRDASGDLRRPVLLEHRVAAGFSPTMLARLDGDPELVRTIADLLLSTNFPDSLHEEIRERLGLPSSLVAAPRKRSARFAQAVFDAWFGACGVCGHDLRLLNGPVGLEAAHIRWHAMAGPDDVNNGIALCSLHHRLFDRGALTIDTSYRVRVSQHLQGASARRVHQLVGHLLDLPSHKDHHPRVEHLEWHHTQVFRGHVCRGQVSGS